MNPPPAEEQSENTVRDETYRLRAHTAIGLVLWRGGLAVAGGYGLFRIAWWAIRFVELPRLMEVGLALVAAGALLIFGTVVAERVIDAREEAARGAEP